jgi:2,4-dienoyl-CoA reductase-like NADH-dependent reductase (Old Yellow Enzyme family)
MSLLFSPLNIKNVTLKNRIVVSPMCQYSAEDGYATDWHLVHLGSRAVGGAGLVIMEATSVSPEGRISPGDLGIYSHEHVAKLKQIVKFIHDNGSVAGIQLAHAGRKASFLAPWKGRDQISNADGGWSTVAPSAIPFSDTDKTPLAMDEIGIEKVKADFKVATLRAIEAGFKVIEIHAAHGYLIHQFFSPLSNQREDIYGGTFENRIRLLLELIEEIQSVWPEENPLFVRISATDWAEGGWTPGESVQLAEILKDKGVDLIDCSSGGLAVGLITEAQQAEDILQKNEADLIFLARELLRDPYFPLHAAEILDADVKWPEQYERAQPEKKA